MPFPIAHSAIALCLSRVMPGLRAGGDGWWNNKAVMALGLVAAVAPDFDFLPGILLGDPNRFHQGPTHSLIGGAICGLMAFALFLPFSKGYRKRPLMIYAVAVGLLHPVLDVFSKDTRPPIGVSLFWPISEVPVHSPIPLFRSINRSSEAGELFPSLFSMPNFMAAGQELLFAIASVAAVWTLMNRHLRGFAFNSGVISMSAWLGFLFMVWSDSSA